MSKNYIPLEEPIVVKQPTSATITYVKLQSLKDAHITYNGQETGKQYVWSRAGSIVDVDSRDATDLLAKRIKTQSCCSVNEAGIFQQVD